MYFFVYICSMDSKRSIVRVYIKAEDVFHNFSSYSVMFKRLDKSQIGIAKSTLKNTLSKTKSNTFENNLCIVSKEPLITE